MDQDAIKTVTIDAGVITYEFAHRRTTVNASGIKQTDQKALKSAFWTNDKDLSAVKFLSGSVEDQAKLESDLASLGFVAKVEDISLSAEQMADIEASGIASKKHIPAYLDRCAQLREENPTWTDATVRAVAKAGA